MSAVFASISLLQYSHLCPEWLAAFIVWNSVRNCQVYIFQSTIFSLSLFRRHSGQTEITSRGEMSYEKLKSIMAIMKERFKYAHFTISPTKIFLLSRTRDEDYII